MGQRLKTPDLAKTTKESLRRSRVAEETDNSGSSGKGSMIFMVEALRKHDPTCAKAHDIARDIRKKKKHSQGG